MTKPIAWCLFTMALLAAGCGSKTLRLDEQPPSDSNPGADAAVDPTVFIPNQPAVMFVMVDATRVYWVTAQPGLGSPPAVVRSCIKEDCAATTITYRTVNGRTTQGFLGSPIETVALDASNVYWVEVDFAKGRSIRACPVAGCPASSPEGEMVAADISTSSLVSDGQFLYWADAGDTAIQRCSIAGCPEGPKPIALTQASPQSLAIEGESLFWIAKSGEASFDVMAVDKGGGDPPTTLVSGQNRTDSLTARAGWVYWTNAYSVGTVLRCPVTGCGNVPIVVADGQHYPHAVAADEKQAYFTNLDQADQGAGSAKLMKCAVEGCGSAATTIDPHVLLYGPSQNSIAVDEKYVYWVTMTELDSNGAFPTASVHRALK